MQKNMPFYHALNFAWGRGRMGPRLHLYNWGTSIKLGTHYIDDLLPYTPLELRSYSECGQMLHNGTAISQI